jgi:glucose-1-phosphate thymidylyltransferase
MKRKGIILAGGSGTRLYPVTKIISKQLLPVYDKPMIYYPLTTLMQCGINDILIITTPDDETNFKRLLNDGSQWGIKLSYIIQPKPEGIAQAFILAENYIENDLVTLILGDNIFYGDNFEVLMHKAFLRKKGATIFAYHVKDPQRYGVIEFSKKDIPISIVEKPKKIKSFFAVTGLYFYDNEVIKHAKNIKPSKRNELEITDLNKIYLEKGNLFVEKLSMGYAWLDTGTHDSLLEASQFISTIENRQGLKIACPEEVAYKKGWITLNNLNDQSKKYNGSYYDYLKKI